MKKNYQAVGNSALLSGSFRCALVFLLFFISMVDTRVAAQSIFNNPITDANPGSYNPFVLGQTVNANITVSGIGRGPGISGNAGINRYTATNWSLAALDVNDYFTFTLTPNSGYLINFVSFVYTGQASGTGPTTFAIRSSVDGFISNIGAPSVTGSTISLAAAQFQNINSAIEFRVYGWGGSNASGTCSINDFTFNGTVVVGPSLSASPLTGFGDVCTNTTPGSNAFTLTGSNLTATNVTVGPLTGYTFSTDNATFAATRNFSIPGNQNQNIYVRFTPTLVQNYDGNIPVSGGGAPAITVPVSGNGVNTVPVITNGTSSGISTSGATISAIISSTGCTAISGYGIEYSTTPGFANGSGTIVPSSNLSGGNYSVVLTGLAPAGQTFYFHTYATNAGGTVYGIENSFTLLNTVPTLSVPGTGAGSLAGFGNVCINTATLTNTFSLSGSVLNGTNIVIGPLANFSFATTAGGPFVNTLNLVNGGGSGYTYSAGNISGTIYVRFAPTNVQSYNGNIPISGGGATAINVAVTASGVNNQPVLTTSSAIFITTTGATVPGTITDAGCGVISGYGIEYSTLAGFAPGTGTQIAASNLASGDFSVIMSGLLPNTVYYYYAYATNAAGTGYGAINSFLTATEPTVLVVTAISPASPIALTPFTITVTAVDNLVNMNPINVTSNTNITLAQTAGANILTFPAVPAGTIAAGSSSVTIPGTFYDVPETGVALTATATSGMVGLGTSAPFSFNVVAYSGPSTFIWSAAGGSAWLTGTNWQTGTSPGSSLPGNQHLASFTSLAGLSNGAGGGCGINMNSVGGDYSLGTIYFANTYSTTHAGDVVPIGNSSTSLSGILSLNGSSLNNVGGISGNNFSSLLIANYMSSASTKTLDIRNGVGSGNKNMTLNLAAAGSMAAGTGNVINLNVLLTGTQSLTFTGGGTLSLAPSGAASVNTFSGPITVANGTLAAGNAGAFSTVAPNIITLGSAPANSGKLKLNGNNITIGGLSTNGTAGLLNTVDNGSTPATLTINNSAGYIFGGSLNNGVAGTLTLVKTGTGVLTLSGFNQYTGNTTVSNGTLRLNYTGGGTIPSGNSITINGGILRVSTDQTINNLTLTSGSLIVDAGATLTITGTYTTGSGFIQNNGTIEMKGTALQSFPGVTVTVTSMNNLIINNNFGVNLNKSLNVGGVLTLTAGTFTVGANTLTINNPIAGTPNNLSANNTSSITIAGTAAGVDLPSSVSQLNNFTISNTVGTYLQGNLNVGGTMFISAAAGTVEADFSVTLNGSGNLTMQGGELKLGKNGVVLPELTGLYNLTGGTVTFDGVGIASDAQTVRPVNYFNLTSSANGGDRILSSTGTIGIANVFTPAIATNNYTVTGSTVDFNKTSGQNIPAFTFYNLRLSGAGGVVKTLAGNINIRAAFTIAANTRFSLSSFDAVLKSDATNTANVDLIPTANSIIYGGTGRFVVERYIPTGVAHGKSWQLLSTPTFGQSVRDAWQEGNAPLAYTTPLFGTTITSDKAGAVSRGYDFYTPNGGSSIKTYNSTTNTWDGIDNGSTNTSVLPIANKKGYMIFVRGDRSVQTSAAPATVTTLRTRGRIYSPGADVPATTAVAAGKLESVGNPYASAIDFINLQSTSTGIDTKFYVWDPLLPSFYGYGGYQTISSVNGYKPVPGGTANYDAAVTYTKIQSGQAFFVYSTPGGTVSFNESNKVAGSDLLFRQSAANAIANGYLRTTLRNLSGEVLDGNIVALSPDFSNGFESDDAIKLQNFGENFGISANGKILSVNARKDFSSNDTVQFNASGLREQTYQLTIAPENMATGILEAYFADRFLQTKSPLNLSGNNQLSITITNDPASKAANRFYIVFKATGPVPVRSIELTAIRNNTDKNTINVNWMVTGETGMASYELQVSADGRNFSSLTHQQPVNNNTGYARYDYTDFNNSSADIFYRVKAISNDGTIQYSRIVKVNGFKSEAGISIYPNPVVDKVLQLQAFNLDGGLYKLQLINDMGQVIYRASIRMGSGNSRQNVQLGSGVAAGRYQLKLESGNKIYSEILIIK